MLTYVDLLAIVTAAGVTFAFTPRVMRMMKERGMVGRDMNKPHQPLIPEMGGVAVVIGFFSGLFLYLLINRNELETGKLDVTLMAVLFAVLGCAFTGILDDLFDLRQAVKAALPFFFALPAGLLLRNAPLEFPLVGLVVATPVVVAVLIPFGITCAANATNMLEGMNGLGAGLLVIIASTLSVIAYINNALISLWLLIPLVGALLAFLFYNRYPARVFPGDTLTVSSGGIIAVAAILGGLMQWGILLMVPMIVEFLLKARGRFRARTYGKVGKDGVLHAPQKRVESLTHLILKVRPMREWQAVGVLWCTEGFVASVVVLAAAWRIAVG